MPSETRAPPHRTACPLGISTTTTRDFLRGSHAPQGGSQGVVSVACEVARRARPAQTIARTVVFCERVHVYTVPWDVFCVRVACCVSQSNLTADAFVSFALPRGQPIHRSVPRSILPPSHRRFRRPARRSFLGARRLALPWPWKVAYAGFSPQRRAARKTGERRCRTFVSV